MTILIEIKNRFDNATDKMHWEKIKSLLFSEDRESVAQGMNLLETLDEGIYYDGVCSFFNDDGKGNWCFKAGLGCGNELALKFEILRMAEELLGHEMKDAFENGCLEELFVAVCGSRESTDLSESEKNRLLSKVTEMVEITEKKYRFMVMKYQVTQILWDNVMGSNPSHFKGVSRPTEQVNWFDCILFANKWSELEGLKKVYEIPTGMAEGCRNHTDDDESLNNFAQHVQVNEGANGYRLPTEAEWRYAADGGDNYKYAGSVDADEVAWYGENWNSGSTHGVGQKKSNGYGLYDLSGNVWEWCFDEDSLDESFGRANRGGSWGNEEYFCEVSYRDVYIASDRSFCSGVRFFRTIPDDL